MYWYEDRIDWIDKKIERKINKESERIENEYK